MMSVSGLELEIYGRYLNGGQKRLHTVGVRTRLREKAVFVFKCIL